MTFPCKFSCMWGRMSQKNSFVLTNAVVIAVLVAFVFIVFNSSSRHQVLSLISCHIDENNLEHKKSKVGDWKYQPTENWTIDQIVDYTLWTNSTSCLLSHVYGGFVRDSNGIDGQRPVCLDSAVAPEKSSGYWPEVIENKFSECLVYSFGIHNEWSFDEAMEKSGCRVYSFDPSMNATNHNHSSKIHYYNLGLGDRDETIPAKSTDGPKDWKMMSLDSIYFKLLNHGNRTIDYLKMDIEGSEWKALPQIMSSGMLDRVRQLGFEAHLFPDEEEVQLEVIRQRIKIVKTLEEVYGFVRFDSKYNPWAWTEININGQEWEGYSAYDLAFYNSKLIRF